MSNYGEPWRYVRDNDGPRLLGNTVGGECLFADICDGDIETDVAMRRAVICVNAIAGVPVPEKLPELLAALLALSAAEDKYDALDKMLAPMEDILDGSARISAAGARVRAAYKAVMGETP